MGLGIIDQQVMFLGYQSKLVLFIAVALAEIWRATAIMMVILVAGMGLIPRSTTRPLRSSAPPVEVLRITLPMLRPSLQTAIILRVILAFEVFAVVALAGTNLPVLMGETYQWEFALQDRGVAAAYAMLILVISIAATFVFLYTLRVPKGRGYDRRSCRDDRARRHQRGAAAGNWLLAACVAVLCVWVLLPIYLLLVNASSPEQVTGFLEVDAPLFDFGSPSS